MLYQFHELNRALFGPATHLAQAGASNFSAPGSWLSQIPGASSVAAGYELLYRLGKTYGKPAFGIDQVDQDLRNRWGEVIDPVEAMLAVIGVSPIVSHEVEQVTPEQWERARDLEFEINKRAHELVAGQTPHASDPPRAPYMRTLRDLTTPYQPAQVEQMLESLPPEMTGLEGQFAALAQKAFFFLGSQLPRQATANSAGWTQLKPPERLFDRFLALMLVLDDPLQVFDLAASGRLLSSQVGAIRAVMPSVLDHMQLSTARELRAERARNHASRVPYHIDIGIQRLLGKDLTPKALRVLLAAPDPQPAQKPAGGGTTEAQVPMQLMTHAQRTENL